MLKSLNIEKLFLIASLFPFVSPYPIDTDVQPISGVMAFFVILKYNYVKKLPMQKKHLFLLVITFILLFYINPEKSLHISFSKAVSLFFGSLILVAFYYSSQYLTSSLFSNIIKVYFLTSIVTILFPEILLSLQGNIVRNINAEGIDGIRGILTFSTEPGLFGGLLISFFLINDYLYTNQKLTKNCYFSNFLMLLLMLIATKSGTGYLLFILYIILKIIIEIKYDFKNIVLIFIFFTSLVLLVYTVDSNSSRGLQIIIQLIENPQELFKLDMSILTRVVSLYIGALSIIQYPFGVGINDISTNIWEVIHTDKFLRDFPKFDGYTNIDKITLVSSFASLVVMYGVIWLIVFYLIFFRISKANLIYKIFAMIFIFVSFSAAFPLIWILLSLEANKARNKELT